MRKNSAWVLLILATAGAGGKLALAQTGKVSVPFEFILLEPGDSSTAEPARKPGPGKFSFDPAAIRYFYHDHSLHSSEYFMQYLPIWDRDLAGFPQTELDPWQMYAAFSVYTLDGTGYLHFYTHQDCAFGTRPCLQPGQYVLTADRGPEYNPDTAVLTVIQDGATFSCEIDNDADGLADADTIAFELPHVIASPNYYIFNNHEHAGEFEDMPKAARVLRNLGWGGEVWVHSAHYGYHYYEQTLDDMGLGDRNVVMVAAEDMPNQGGGHFMVFPQYPFAVNPEFYGRNHLADPAAFCDPYCPLDSAACQRYCPDVGRYYYGQAIEYRWANLNSPFHFIHQRDLYQNATGHPAVFVPAHPECTTSAGYFLDMLENDGSGKVRETNFARGTWRDDFDALEFRADPNCKNRLATWYSLLNQGYRYPLVSGNDNHWLNGGIYGHCSYVYSELGPADNDRQAMVDSFVANLKKGHAFVSFGPFLQLSVQNAGGTAVIADALAGTVLDATDGSTYAADGAISFHLELQERWPCPQEYVHAVVNGATVIAGDPVVWTEAEIMPGHTVCHYANDYPIAFERDSWVVFLTGAPAITYADSVAAITNPIEVEFNGAPGIDPVIHRPAIADLEVRVGDTIVSETDPARPGDTLAISFSVAPGATVTMVNAYVSPSPSRYGGSTVDLNPASCRETPPGSRQYLCEYVVEGVHPVMDGDANEVRVSVKDASGYRGWAYDKVNVTLSDSDADGLPDWWENYYRLATLGCGGPGDDCDGDSLQNLEEFSLGDNVVYPLSWYRKGWRLGWTSPRLADSDGDKLNDALEAVVSGCSNQNLFDTDKDGLCDGDTAVRGPYWYASDGGPSNKPWPFLQPGTACWAGEDLDRNGRVLPGVETDPCNPDTDRDGLADGWEYYYSHYGDTCALDPLAADAGFDPDSDTLSNMEEYRIWTHPCLPDTDSDGLGDAEELTIHGTDPRHPDSDRDGIPDGYEAENGIAPLLADSDLDPDGDALVNLDEYLLGADPQSPDSDGDSMTDGWEAIYAHCGLDLLAPDDQADADLEGLDNLLEFNLGTDPCDPDSDHDSLNDADEIAYGGSPNKYKPGHDTDPLDPDSDHEGMSDGWEVAAAACGLDPLTADAGLDADADGLENILEFALGTGPCIPDSEGDGLPDGYEYLYGFDPLTDDAAGDPDGDGLDNLGEYLAGTGPLVADSDGDGMGDGWETIHRACGFDPLAPDAAGDPDGDLLDNVAESRRGTDPCDPDSDSDTMPDGYEDQYGLDPAADDGQQDLDGDGLDNLAEFLAGTRPDLPDSDGDGMSDGWETNHAACGFNPLIPDSAADLDGDSLDNTAESQSGTDPCNPDTDADTMSDGYEVKYQLDPLRDDRREDLDGDRLDNLGEFLAGTKPNDPDSDHDLMDDGFESLFAACGLDPLFPDAASDPDGDLLESRDEALNSTDPCRPDTDRDAMPDGCEVQYGLDPLIPDAASDPDGDGLASVLECSLGANPAATDSDLDAMPDNWEYRHAGCGLDLAAGDSTLDPDGDGALNLAEFNARANPCSSDSDADGLGDQVEIAAAGCPDPINPDSDGDGLADGGPAGEDRDGDGTVAPDESNPCLADSDGDGVPDGDEELYGTLPFAWDSDQDLLPDDFELLHAGDADLPLDPLDPGDGAADFDADGNPNAHEYWNRSDLWRPDPMVGYGLNASCYFWGDGDGDGYPGPGDIAKVQLAYVGGAEDYSRVLPPSFDPLDLDKDGYPGPGDINLIQSMYVNSNRPGGYPSTPAALTVTSEPGAAVIKEGGAVRVAVSVTSRGPGTVLYSSAFAVVFEVESGPAALMGGDGALPDGPAGNRFDVSAEARDGAPASIALKVTGPGPIVIRARIPACGIYPKGRWAPEVVLPDPIVINGP